MTRKNSSAAPFKPDWRSAPGETIEDLLEEFELSHEDFANLMNMTPQAAEDLLAGKTILDKPIAAALAECFGISTDFWLTREAHYREPIK